MILTQAAVISDGKLLIHTETLLEFVNTSACVNKLLLTCEERMTLGAYFDSDIGLCGTGLDHVSASAGNGSFLIIRVKTFFHFNTSSLFILYD